MEKFVLEKELAKDLKLIRMKSFKDMRGEYIKSYSERDLFSLGINNKFLEDNYLISKKGSIRGLHYQRDNPEAKLIRCLEGSIMDIVVDLRKNSDTYKNVFKIKLSRGDNLIFSVPEGFAHGFISLTDSTVLYKSSNYYFPEDQHGVSIFSSEIGLDKVLEKEKIENIIVTEKDKSHAKIRDI
ncbi:dTDP-4-dehydrorhamnose 3,5-epimerase family protein [uncultured Ilyobacter sp.]|uniref:dTDP-4-dehydrorhamnose 3,5-epimerase family protein n=1 Tax=uncultured Ilyobacter sp. TaxID=544433 RepID=UPI0029C0D4E0|nr:dTDP-4-dehydrorhamnose 3,5-epimerase family protein [uncultured Ilyobacter sp.]